MTAKSVRAPQLIKCPTCKKGVVYDTANKFRPFCSERCKNEDIIAWADEGFRIAGKPLDPDEEGDGKSPFRHNDAEGESD